MLSGPGARGAVILLTFVCVACGGKAKHAGIDAGSPEVDVSNRVGNQTHATIAVQPGRPSILLAASVDRTAQTTTRLYSSLNGGKTWTSTLRPSTHSGNACSIDPAVTIDRRGRQFFTFLGVAHPIWTDTRRFADLGEEIYTRALSATGLP
jgi:hypothetical protein